MLARRAVSYAFVLSSGGPRDYFAEAERPKRITRRFSVGGRLSAEVELSSGRRRKEKAIESNGSGTTPRESSWTRSVNRALHEIEKEGRLFTRPFPMKSEWAPYSKSMPKGCGARLDCSSTRLGIGRRGHIPSWICAILAPFLSVSMILFASSLKPRTYGNLKVHTRVSFVAMLLTQMFAAVAGRFCYFVSNQTVGELCVILMALLALMLSIIATFSLSDVEFDWPAWPCSAYLEGVSWLYCVVLFLIELLLGIAKRCLSLSPGSDLLKVVMNDVILVWVCFRAALVPRNTAFVLVLYYTFKMYTYSFYVWDDTTGYALNSLWPSKFPALFVRCIFVLLCFAAPYSRDRYFIAAFGCLLLITMNIGMNGENVSAVIKRDFGHVPLETWYQFILVVLFSFACCIAMRFQIVLPEELQKIRYLRLGYLQETRRKGLKITRCQDLPNSAFGNPAKVVHMIIISHHWLDGRTCDTVTLECPSGLRLTTMCQRLERFFPSCWPGFSVIRKNPLSALSMALESALLSSHDCLLFFDFMCLPQIGMRADGTLIERTADEEALFKVVLPACGLLYTMFPVMVCPEVNEGVIPYLSSGWCFCEWEQSTLCGTLSPYSVDPDDHGELCSLVSSATSSENSLLDIVIKELDQKQFRSEGDRDYVRGIFRGTWVRRALVAAVRDQDAKKVQDLLNQLEDHNLKSTISFPVDALTLDSLLHVAKKLPSKEIQDLLIDNGADPERPNHRGELPGQWLIFPRSWLHCSR